LISILEYKPDKTDRAWSTILIPLGFDVIHIDNLDMFKIANSLISNGCKHFLVDYAYLKGMHLKGDTLLFGYLLAMKFTIVIIINFAEEEESCRSLKA
jgi:hypothetical protein